MPWWVQVTDVAYPCMFCVSVSGLGLGGSRLEDKYLAGELQDEEGYFEHKVGERLKGRYKVRGYT